MGEGIETCIPGFAGLIGLILSLAGGLWCRLVTIPVNPDFNFSAVGVDAPPDIQYGLFGRRRLDLEGFSWDNSTMQFTVYYTSACYSFPEAVEKDRPWKSAVVMSIISYIWAAIFIAVLFVAGCTGGLSSKTLMFIGLNFSVIITTFMGLIFLFMNSKICTNNPFSDIGTLQGVGLYEDSCSLGSSGIMVIVAVVIYFLTGLGCCMLAKKGKSSDSEPAAPEKDEPVKDEQEPEAPAAEATTNAEAEEN
jgi:hypothetical protein